MPHHRFVYYLKLLLYFVVVILLSLLLLLLFETVSLHGPYRLGTHYIAQTGLEFTYTPLFVPSIGIKGVYHLGQQKLFLMINPIVQSFFNLIESLGLSPFSRNIYCSFCSYFSLNIYRIVRVGGPGSFIPLGSVPAVRFRMGKQQLLKEDDFLTGTKSTACGEEYSWERGL